MFLCDKCEGEITNEDTYKCIIKECQIKIHHSCVSDTSSCKELWFCNSHEKELNEALETYQHSSEESNQLSNAEYKQQEDSGELSFEMSEEEIAYLKNKMSRTEIKNKIDDKYVTQRRNKDKFVPFDNGNPFNPFANFACEICENIITQSNKGALCHDCRSVFHVDCLTEIEIKSVHNYTFLCQDCILERNRLETLKEKQRKEIKKSLNQIAIDEDKDEDRSKSKSHNTSSIITSTPILNKQNESHKSNKKRKSLFKVNGRKSLFSSSDSEESKHYDSDYDTSNTDSDSKLSQKKNKKNYSHMRKQKMKSDSSLSEDSDSDHEISKTEAICELYKFTRDERKKSKYEKLPIVDRADMKWKVFFDLFKESRKLFCDSENIIRIQNSIKCNEILDIGGINLFDPYTYWKTLKLIDKRLCSSYNLLKKETQEVIKLKKIKNDCEAKKVIEFINKIVNYNNIVEKHGKKKDKIDDRIISHITNVMPNYLLNGWHRKKARLDEKDKTVYLKDIAKYLSKQVAYLNSKVHAEENDPWKENNERFIKRYDNKDKYLRRNYQTDVSDISHTDDNKNGNKVYCWFHRNSSHSAFSCAALWAMSGREVSEFAKKNNICTYCGHKKHFNCPNKDKLKCRIEGCSLNHNMLFCFKRKSKNDNRNNSHEEKYSSKRKDNENQMNKKDISNNNRNHDNDNSSSSQEDSNDESRHDIPHSKYYLHDTEQNSHKFNRITSIRHTDTSLPIKTTNLNCNLNNNKVKMRTSPCLLGVIVIKFIDCNETATFLLDSGSTVSLIEERIANKFDIKGLWYPITLNWSNNIKRSDYKSRVIKANVSSPYPNASQHVIYFRTLKDLNIDDQIFDADEMYDEYPYLKKLKLQSYDKIDGIIGMDNAWVFNQKETCMPNNWKSNKPFGIRCPLGDYVVGNVNQLESLYSHLYNETMPPKTHNRHSYHIHLSENEQLELIEMENEILGLDYKKPVAYDNARYDDELALNMLNKYVKRSEDNLHFEAPLLWRDENIELPTKESFKVALRRFLIVEKNSIKNGTHKECIDQVSNLLKKGYAEEVPSHELDNSNNKKIFYIPTFFIKPKNKRTRFIWDAASKVEGRALNDYLLSGPNMYNDYLKMIFNMQEGKYLIKGDIAEMFHQVIMRPEDRDSLRFLYRESPKDKIKVLRMKVMIFGSKSSPITSQFIKNKITEGFEKEYPHAVDAIRNKTYVDDVVTSVNDFEQGKDLIYDIRKILSTGGFNLVKLNSNDSKILSKVRTKLNKNEILNEKIFSTDSHEKLLGYDLNFELDTISLALTLEKIPGEIINCELKPTKKQILQVCMSIFDPVGYAEFLLSKFKLIFHWTIKEKYEWNQMIDDKYFTIWKKCMKWLQEVKTIQIPRWYTPNLSHAKVIQLIGFCDASTEILCNVIYIRILDENRQQLDYRFVCAKSYIVPLKQNRTIPELELDAAEKLTQLMQKVVKQHNITFDEFIYCIDNTAVREWIINDAKNPKIYVKNRINKIQKITKPEEWRWVPTNLQPADFGTKVTSMPNIAYNSEWFHPKIFCLPEDNWPQLESNIEKLNITAINNEHDLDENKIFCFENFSSLNKMIRIAQVCLKFKIFVQLKKKSKEIETLKAIDVRTRKAANDIDEKIKVIENIKCEIQSKINEKDFKYSEIELNLIRMAQIESFKDEYYALKSKRSLNKSCMLRKILAYVDNDGIIRAKSRITDNNENIELFGFDRINPIVLPRLHHLTKLIILKYHNAQAHHNEKTVVVNLLQRFFINKIKRTVNNVIRNNCMKCRISHAKPGIPLMGDLPNHRLAIKMPTFSFVIVDLLGPLIVKVTKNVTAKRYVLVYSCLTTRALHLELIESLEAQATLRALQITFNLRGVPLKICSDNGTNFVGGNNILQNNHDKWNRKLLESGAISHAIEWDFSPPRAPHMNGSVERMVGLVKNAMKHIHENKSNYDDYTLRCILSEVINMLNSRPIEIICHEDNQHEYLTPNHFIMGRQNAQSVPPSNIKPQLLTQQWEDIKVNSNIIWDKWMKVFLPKILMREKWHDYSKPLEIGDIVMTVDPSIANSWRIGVVENIIIGSKQQVRQVVVKLGKNKLIDQGIVMNSSQLMQEYQKENEVVVTRPAIAVAKINLSCS